VEASLLVAALTGQEKTEADRERGESASAPACKVILERADELARNGDSAPGKMGRVARGGGASVSERHLLTAVLDQGGGTSAHRLERWEINLKAIRDYVEAARVPAAGHELFEAGGPLAGQPAGGRGAAGAGAGPGSTRAAGRLGYLATPYLCRALLAEGPCGRAALAEQGTRPGDGARRPGRPRRGRARPAPRARLRLYHLSRPGSRGS